MKTWWNYRVVQRDGYVELIEAHYKNKSNPRIWAYAKVGTPIGNDMPDLAGELAHMAEALDRPIIQSYELPRSPKKGKSS